MSLAEFDGWFNKRAAVVEKHAGRKTSIYAYGKPCLIRAFNLANGIAPAKSGLSDVPSGAACLEKKTKERVRARATPKDSREQPAR